MRTHHLGHLGHLGRLAALGFGLATLVTISGCIFVASDETKPGPQPTMGRQLVDLKAAHDSGAIDDKEFQTTKTKLLSNCK